jgi:hypothetical protein
MSRIEACFCYSEMIHPFIFGMQHDGVHASNMRKVPSVLSVPLVYVCLCLL